jgi:hypothetical protein
VERSQPGVGVVEYRPRIGVLNFKCERAPACFVNNRASLHQLSLKAVCITTWDT